MPKVDPVETLARQNCATIVAHYTARAAAPHAGGRNPYSPLTGGFRCKICSKVFGTFQALGGHVSSHAKHAFDSTARAVAQPDSDPAKPHECSECHVRFPSGQALGGHMRRHFDLIAKRKRAGQGEKAPLEKKKKEEEAVKTESFCGKRDGILLLDLNLPPGDQGALSDSHLHV